LVKLRSFAERIVDHLYTRLRLPRAPQSNFADLLANASFTVLADRLVLDKFHLLRKLGNRAAHGEDVQANDALAGGYGKRGNLLAGCMSRFWAATWPTSATSASSTRRHR